MRDTILCLCDLTGVMARPWVEHGYRAVLVDPQYGIDHEDGAYLKLACTIEEAFDQISVLLRSGRLAFVAGFPPCTDMAVSGAQWFARKYEADHLFQAKAVSVAEQCRVIGEMSGVPYMVENPVSVLSNVFGKPSHTFDPCDYTRYAPEDNYTKKTCLWTGGGFQMPPRSQDMSLPAPDRNRIWYMSGKDRANNRSKTPLGFARAVYEVNQGKATEE